MAIVEQSRTYRRRAPSPAAAWTDDPLWYRHAIIYQLSVRSFYDSNADGVGDLPGLVEKLDYLQDLGVTALWLLPFQPSPLKDDGYDTVDFRGVHPQCGTRRAFKSLLTETHRRQMRVIVELALNHTSDQHPWFERARRAAAGSTWRDFYVWSDRLDRFPEARRIFSDREPSNWTWDPVAEAYYFHRFYHHQPDLNYNNREVRRAIGQVVDYWLATGVDGLGLNTVAYLYEREGTTCENLPENHAFLRSLRRHVDERFPGRVLAAVADQWPEEAAAYFGQGDECQAALHFPLMPRFFMALDRENRRPIVDIIQQTPAGPAGAQWVLFLRNQDELTLQMVTEPERAAMLRAYGRDPQWRVHLGIRRRLAPLLENNRAKIELLFGLLFSLPGTPALYYGDEIGMGDNPYLGDRAGVRTPMQWSPDRNAGFSGAGGQQLVLPVITDPQCHYETVNVQTECRNPDSLLSWVKRAIVRRKLSPALTSGSLDLLEPPNPKILAFVRRHADEAVLVVANLSRFAQVSRVELPEFRGYTPVEAFGGMPFPPLDEPPYTLVLPPHGFYWLTLCPPQKPGGGDAQAGYSLITGPPPAVIEVDGPWTDVFAEPSRRRLERVLPGFLATRRWFGGKAHRVRAARLADVIPMPYGEAWAMFWTIVAVDYADAQPERYLLALGVSAEDHLRWNNAMPAESVLARLRCEGDESGADLLLYDLLGEEEFGAALLATIAARKNLPGHAGRIKASTTRAFARLRGDDSQRLPTRALKAETTNSLILYDERFLLKLVRRLDEGVNPDLEIGRFLTESAAFAHAPPVAGALEYLADQDEPVTLAMLFGFVRNEGNAWEYTRVALDGFFEGLLSDTPVVGPPAAAELAVPMVELAAREVPPAVSERLGSYLSSAELLGRRTAEMHPALASDADQPGFAPEPITQLYRRSLYQELRNQAAAAFQVLHERFDVLPEESRRDAQRIFSEEQALTERFRPLIAESVAATRIRCHGDLHLGQVLYTGADFVIIDFEGEPARPICERQFKASPLRDVAGMLRSFDYACHAAAAEHLASATLDDDDRRQLDEWSQCWVARASAAYLRSYLAVARGASFLPRSEGHMQLLLDAYLAEKVLYELQYELNNRPAWAFIPLKGLARLLGAAE